MITGHRKFALIFLALTSPELSFAENSISPIPGSYGHGSSYFEVFAAQQLISEFNLRKCQFYFYNQLEGIGAIFVVNADRQGYSYVLHRKFDKNIWIDMRKEMAKRKMNPESNLNQANILSTIDYEVIENRALVKNTNIQKELAICEGVTVAPRSEEQPTFDDGRIYFSHYHDNSGYLVGRFSLETNPTLYKIAISLKNIFKK